MVPTFPKVSMLSNLLAPNTCATEFITMEAAVGAGRTSAIETFHKTLSKFGAKVCEVTFKTCYNLQTISEICCGADLGRRSEMWGDRN